MTTRKLNVVFEQYSIPHYRIPFFERLSREVNLLVVASKDISIDGVLEADGNLPFSVIRCRETPQGSGFHEEIFDILSNHKADIYISYGSLLNYMLSKQLIKEMINSNIKIAWMGCDGYWVRNFLIEKFMRFLPWNPKALYRTLRESCVIRKTDAFICHSSHMAQYFRIVHGVPGKKIFLAHNAIDTSSLLEQYHRYCDLRVKKNKCEIVFVGRLVRSKSIDVLIKAFSRALQRYPETRLKIIGGGSDQALLQQLVRDLAISDRVTFYGAVYDAEELGRLMSTSSLYVIPGLGGLGINTGMAMGLPIICSYADGTEDDLINEGYNGWRFDGSENDLVRVLIKALRDQELLAEMGGLSARLIENDFNLDRMVRGYVKAFNSLMV